MSGLPMTSRSRRPASLVLGLVALVVATLLAACGGTREYAATPLPATPVPSSSPPSTATPVVCDDWLVSYAPQPPTITSKTLARIRKNKRLVAGISADTLLFGARNARSAQIEGFDIDLVRALARTILGDPNAVELKVIIAADRITLLQNGTVDVVARTMTMNCARWKDIAFSAQYYQAGQRLLVADTSKITSVKGLKAGDRVCAPAGSTSLANIKLAAPDAEAVPADTHTGCLILFQQSKVDAITGDDTVLAGLAFQDPFTKIVGPTFSSEPYGVGLPPKDPQFAGVVNTALATWIASGGWRASYDKWLAADLGPAPAPPRPQYGRK